MDFEIDFARDMLSRTPDVLHSLLWDLPAEWATHNEGQDTWSPYDVVGHLIHGELTDWVPRTRIILERGVEETFEPFDRFAQFESSAGKSLNELLQEFAILRKQNLELLDELDLTAHDLALEGRHPEFGVVTLGQLLSTWVVHDLDHIGQIVRVMSNGYASEVGPWAAYLRILSA